MVITEEKRPRSYTVYPVNPVIRYHARVVGGGRIVIPDITRKLLGIEKGNIVSLKVAKIAKVETGNETLIIETSEPIIIEARVGNKGLVTIPEEARKLLGINVGDIVEVALVGIIKANVGAVKKIKEEAE